MDGTTIALQKLASAGSMHRFGQVTMPREHPLCQFGLLILFLQTFEESMLNHEPSSHLTTFFLFRVVERSLSAASLIPRADQAARPRAGGSSRAVSLCLRRSFRV